MGIGFFRSFTCDADAVIIDTSGNNLNRVRIHERDNIYSYSFSKQPDNQTYEGFDVAEKHVIIKNNHQMTKHDAVTQTRSTIIVTVVEYISVMPKETIR